jgi:hypothetical protein
MDEKLKGKRVVLIFMDDQYTDLTSGDEGTIRGVDDIGNILVTWDKGSTLSLIPNIDKYIIEEE